MKFLATGPQGGEMSAEVKNVKVVYEPDVTLRDVTKAYVIRAMDHHGGNKHKVAHALGITIKTLYNWFHEWDLDFRGRNWVKGQASNGEPFTFVSEADYKAWRDRSARCSCFGA